MPRLLLFPNPGKLKIHRRREISLSLSLPLSEGARENKEPLSFSVLADGEDLKLQHDIRIILFWVAFSFGLGHLMNMVVGLSSEDCIDPKSC